MIYGSRNRLAYGQLHEYIGGNIIDGKHKLRIQLEILLVITAIIIVPLCYAVRSQAGQMANANTPPPSAIPGGSRVPNTPISPKFAVPTAAPVVANGKEPPPCSFPLAQIAAVASTIGRLKTF